MDIGWDFFQNDLRVTEVVPSQKFSEKLSQLLEQTSIASLDFSGLDQLTDEVFLVLQDKFKEQKQRDFVKSVKCLGCVYITDYGVMLMADTFPSLEEVVLDGCSSLSKVAAECLIVKCPSLKHLSMVATAVCNPPAIADREIDLQFAGCPLIPQNGEPQDAYEYPLKLVICSKANNLFSLTDFLLSSPSKSTELTPESPGIMKHSTSLKLANFEKPVSYTPLMVVIFHDNEKLDEKEEEFSNLYKQLSEFIEMHKQLLQLHLTAEHYSAVPEGPKVFHSRDFHAQQLYMKSHMASHQEFSLRMLTVNVATSQVRDYSTSASGDEGVCNQEEMVAIMAEVEPRVSHACALLQTLSKSEISMDTSWHAIKRMLNDFTLIRNLLSFDATNITDQMLEKVGEIRKNEDLNVEKLKRSSLAAVAFWAWVDAKYLEAIALKKIAAIKAKPQVSSKTTSMGEIIYVSDDESDHGIIITDIQWFMEILKKLQSLQNIGVDVKVNGSRFKALPPEIPLLNVDFLVGFIEGSSTEQIKLVVRVLKISGELMTVPVTSMDEERDGQMFLFTHLQDKFYLRTGLDKGHCSSLFRKKAWAESGTSRLTTDIQIDYHYRLPIGVPPSFWPRLLQECSSIGLTASIYKWGILLKSGAAEILLVHDIHGSTVSSSIDVHARLTRWNEKTDMKTFTAYLWGAVNRYLLLVEGFANKYPFLATKVRIPCKGHGCTSLGTARTLKPIHLPTEFEGEIFCAQCGDDGMTQDETLLLTGRHNPFPMHNIAPLPSNGHMNELAPYAYEMKRLVASQEIHPLEYCVVCGVLSVASEALWRLQSNMYPCQALHCINFEKSLVKNLRIQSNFVQALPRSSEEGEGHQGWYEGLMVTRMRALRQGQMIISFSVLKAGNIEIFIGDKEAIEILNCEGISSKTAFYYHLGTGIIETVDYVKSTEVEPIKLQQQDPHWLLVIDLTVYKNGEHVLDAWVPRHKHNLAFKLHPDGESCPALIYNIPKFPMIRAAHFPLGCMLLHKTGIGNQWAVMRVLARKDGLLYLGTNKDDLNTDRITIVKPSSQKLRPYGNYSESFTVIAPKGNVKQPFKTFA
ncbi:hypothetical protein CAPTEDRAFT_214303 [Capitella teleta]|uniref:Uncharacterized protein n=1 Tax=Capitella teleta TaxID=283909 RepID=R7VJR3_CAPTE|nr:hypothetical protein CAPTEDRAFT_214303 [Capitella teleta]|eukprot:ELU16140.1 hypothetical protein CAPTEDRAFT_214303 [Capitella teleta]